MFPRFIPNSENCSNVASSTLRTHINESKTGSKKDIYSSYIKASNHSLSVLHATTATNDAESSDDASNLVATPGTRATKRDDLINEPPNNSIALKSCYDCKMFNQTTKYCTGFNFKLPEPANHYRCLRFVGKINVVDLNQQLIKEGIRLKRNGDKLTIRGMKTQEQKNTIISYKAELIQYLNVKEKLDCIECDTEDLLDWYKDDLPQIDEMSLEELHKRVEGYQKYRIYYRG